MTTELQQAAERLQLVDKGHSIETVYKDMVAYLTSPEFHYNNDVRKVYQAYLAEHPADDGEAIDRNWLLECGLVVCGNPNAVRLQRNDDLYMILRDDGQWLPAFQNGLHGWIRLKPIATRGRFRTLLTLLQSR